MRSINEFKASAFELCEQQKERIDELLLALKANKDYDACSGLMASIDSKGIIEIFDDSYSVIVDPTATIENLEKANPIEWDGETRSDKDQLELIWDCIVEAND